MLKAWASTLHRTSNITVSEGTQTPSRDSHLSLTNSQDYTYQVCGPWTGICIPRLGWLAFKTFNAVSYGSNLDILSHTHDSVQYSIMTAIGSITDIDDEISHYQRILLSIPWSHPLHFSYVRHLGAVYRNRYLLSRQKKDLDRSILNFTEAILIAPPWDRDDQNIIETLFSLAHGLLIRLDDFDQSSDAQHCAAYFCYLRSQPLETFSIPCDISKPFFLSALASQLKWNVGDASQNIEEMTVHCCELLASNIPLVLLGRATRKLATAYYSYLKQSSILEVPEEVIKFLQEQNIR